MIFFHPIRPLSGLPPELMGADPTPPAITVEGHLWPLLWVKFGRSATAEEFEAYLELREDWLARQEPHVSIIDAREVVVQPQNLRQRYTEWLRENDKAVHRWSLGSVYVLQSPEVRMMMSLIRHFAQLTTPFLVTPTLPPAAVWAANRLQEAGLTQAATRVRTAHGIAAS